MPEPLLPDREALIGCFHLTKAALPHLQEGNVLLPGAGVGRVIQRRHVDRLEVCVSLICGRRKYFGRQISMADIRSIRLRQLQGRLGDVVYQLTRVQFPEFSPAGSWRPPVNAYRCRERMTICVDLAGVERAAVDLQVEPRRLLLRGKRELPEPRGNEEKPVQILAMELDHGPFEREINFPADVEPARVTAEQRNGLLWVYLPWRSPA